MKDNRLALLGGLALLLGATTAYSAEGWGTIKGQVVWGDKELPVRPQIKVDKDQAHCLRNGPLLAQTYIVDPKTKGVEYVMVWLTNSANPKDYTAKIPINPKLKELKEKTVSLDQPCCLFEPPVLALRVGQTLIAKNSATIPHNVKIDGDASGNPSLNTLIPPGKQVEVEGWKPTKLGAVPVGCTIHGWMRGDVRVFNHPYYAVTNEKGEFEIKDAPAGKYNIVMWHPTTGFVNGDRTGTVINIKADGTVDLGQIKMGPAK